MEYDESGKESDVIKTDSSIGTQLRETKLEPRVAKFISLICNISMMKQQMMEIGYNADKLPLGKLSKSTILKGYDVLKRIAYKLKKKLEMVEALGEIEVASKLLADDTLEEEDPLHYRYQQLHCEQMPVENNSEEFAMIVKYIQNIHAKTHSNYMVDVAQIFKVTREGLRIAPPEAPVTGYMFGKGVYFADMFSKIANYCYANSAFRTGVLLLCEVALGDMAELLQDPSEAETLDDGVIVPLGKPKEQKREGALWYNEYIVYNVDQIRMRYLIQAQLVPKCRQVHVWSNAQQANLGTSRNPSTPPRCTPLNHARFSRQPPTARKDFACITNKQPRIIILGLSSTNKT
ncbi:Poly polymerase 2 [Hibiscus syriacus]|uniref:Poly [ADP-ribose] polymerase n=1 Tax=Hibiscus syriacus TaxID=106335 RepID=A0A6A3A0V2_HIBSY|nr:Poly polymerase 2 [Hibiscus syriacus]